MFGHVRRAASGARPSAVRVLLVSQMYPGPDDPDLGTFVAQLERALAERGHEIERAVLDRRRRQAPAPRAARERTSARPARFRPDVVYAHFLVPAGLIAALASRAPLVVTAHGQDVAQRRRASRASRRRPRCVVRRAAAVIAVSDYLRRELEAKVPAARGKTEVIDCGVDLERFRAAPRAGRGRPAFLCVGSLTERKNVAPARRRVRAARRGHARPSSATARCARELEGRAGHPAARRRPARPGSGAGSPRRTSSASRAWSSRSARRCSRRWRAGRSVVATQVGGPPEFVTPEAGVLVDPLGRRRRSPRRCARAAALPCPNPAARAAAERHDVNEQAAPVEAILERAARDRRA